MILRSLLFALLFTTMTCASAAERLILNFELAQGKNLIESGRSLTTKKPLTWNKGLKRSYLKVRCQQHKTGEIQKLYSTEDHFHGILVSHQIIGDKVEITVTQGIVQPRLDEIRALAKNECKDLSPVVNTTTHTYSFPA